MSRLLTLLVGALAFSAIFVSSYADADEVVSIPLDRSVKIALPAGAKRVMLGNAGVADITVIDMQTAVLLGRTFGETNLLVLDDRGRTLMDQVLMVTDSARGRVTMITGPHGGTSTSSSASILNYACSPRCVRYPMPGENETDQAGYINAYEQYPGRASGSRQGGASSGSASGTLGSLTTMADSSQSGGSAANTSKQMVP
ncbi:MAG: hypothetical protein CGW95_16020 [Phenylobacterium zucineum]|nr:MAG: hypothetical protein CGW95_16020 [Phenylobacterium zucineum]